MDDIIDIQKENIEFHLETECDDLSKEGKAVFKMKTKKLQTDLKKSEEKRTKIKSIKRKTNATPQALEESLNDTDGFFLTIATEQTLLDTLVAGKGKASNEILLSGRNSEDVSSIRRTRNGYTGKVTGSFVCFAQNGSIKKVIDSSNSSGLCERFLMVTEPEVGYLKDHHRKVPDNSALLNEYKKKFYFLKNLIKKPLKHNELITLKISEKGLNIINEFKNKLEHLIINNQVFSHDILRVMAKKSDIQIMSIASNLHLLECDELPLFKGENFIDNRYVYMAISITEAMLYHARYCLIKEGYIENKEEIKAVIDYFIDNKTGEHKNMKININTIIQKKVFDRVKNKTLAVNNIINNLIQTNNLIKNQDGTYRLNSYVSI